MFVRVLNLKEREHTLDKVYLPHAQEKDCGWRISLEIVKRFGPRRHGHVSCQCSELEAMFRKLLLKPVKRGTELREDQAFGCGPNR